mmetsp:Transcript_11066/g.45143  ORF Transcript_11066/g.45143 Transcript_11066/m.45143 type:complete len:258 (-) Transcript_11066:36-809(-)
MATVPRKQAVVSRTVTRQGAGAANYSQHSSSTRIGLPFLGFSFGNASESLDMRLVKNCKESTSVSVVDSSCGMDALPHPATTTRDALIQCRSSDITDEAITVHFNAQDAVVEAADTLRIGMGFPLVGRFLGGTKAVAAHGAPSKDQCAHSFEGSIGPGYLLCTKVITLTATESQFFMESVLHERTSSSTSNWVVFSHSEASSSTNATVAMDVRTDTTTAHAALFRRLCQRCCDALEPQEQAESAHAALLNLIERGDA